MKKIFFIILLALFVPLGAWAELKLEGRSFAPGSRHVTAENSGALLAGMFSYGAAIYEFPAPPGLSRAGVELEFENLKGKWLKLYIYNYGPAQDQDAVRNRWIDPNWRLWEATAGSGTWMTGHPEYIDLRPENGRDDYLGPQRQIRILLFAHGGLPYIGDARFLIKRVSLVFPDEADIKKIKDLLVLSQDAWVEGEFLLARGRGRPSPSGEERAGRIAALRAAKVLAMRNLAAALGRLPGDRGTAAVPPHRVRDTQYHPDGSAEVVLEVRISDLIE